MHVAILSYWARGIEPYNNFLNLYFLSPKINNAPCNSYGH